MISSICHEWNNLQFLVWMVVELLDFQFSPNRCDGKINVHVYLLRPVRHSPIALVDFSSTTRESIHKTENEWVTHTKSNEIVTITPLQISLDSLLKLFGYDTLWSVIAANSSSSSSPSNGGWPTSISYKSTPYAHQSTDLPYGWYKMIWIDMSKRYRRTFDLTEFEVEFEKRKIPQERYSRECHRMFL